MILPIALLLGLGGGCVDSALNNYVSLHYSTGAMSFLHGFWGVGTTIGPILLGVIIPLGYTWRTGYSAISAIQGVILVLFLIGFPLWKLNEEKEARAKHIKETYKSLMQEIKSYNEDYNEPAQIPFASTFSKLFDSLF